MLQGALDVMLNGKWTTFKQGETVTVPKGAAHPEEMRPVNPPPFAVSVLNRIGKWKGIKI
ncbi:cupin domain-containing protein [Flavisolibacter ginsenosidimutans]|uniref:Cupin domain-containing protein n=1 Tax=Flavisolibacter ginsenosidimutans TaxID=661481 RepID=A0A5B8UL52_9BACT|nr:cupin domain-containing protein [Flavisolibacter ginsenosidimutans]QEC56745.1 cupin domain-containing protein [Flavisolibacter ginsenosidimutans]